MNNHNKKKQQQDNIFIFTVALAVSIPLVGSSPFLRRLIRPLQTVYLVSIPLVGSSPFLLYLPCSLCGKFQECVNTLSRVFSISTGIHIASIGMTEKCVNTLSRVFSISTLLFQSPHKYWAVEVNFAYVLE